MGFDLNDFLASCKQSSQSAYAAFKSLLDQLDNTESRPAALVFLAQLSQHFEAQRPTDCHFQFLDQGILDADDKPLNLRLLQFPSTFLPEAWSFTFYEGLIRYPASEYRQKQMLELGCGIGWISIALALRYGPKLITGLDINPKAVTCARLNLYLNAFNQQGEAKLLADGQRLFDKVDFFESNLFSHFKDQSDLQLDTIIGCIPQVLNPEPQVMENLIQETASDEYLQSLSNYFAKQGYIEDQFGLGLIASAVEQSIPLLKSNAKLILNLGGRPGRSVLERLMQRRGFAVRRVWQTQVEQAADTEIDALVEIEQSIGHRFEFYMADDADTPIDATTASQFARAGGKIYHSVDVYEAQLLFPQQVKSIYESVDKIGGPALRSAVDLTYDNLDDAEERYSFLAFLAKKLQSTQQFPYAETAGLSYFRQQLAEYFEYYLKLDTSEEQLLITPGRQELLAAIVANYKPERVLVEKSLAALLNNKLAPKSQILQVPALIEDLKELMAKLQPQLVITRIEAREIQSSQLFEQLVEAAKVSDCLLVIDLTENINLSSQPEINGVYRYLARQQLPPNLIIMASLVNNKVYQNYSLNFALLNNPDLRQQLIDAAELTYSRTPWLKQLYYGHLLEELLFFQRSRKALGKEQKIQNLPTSLKPLSQPLPLPLSESANAAFAHPAIKGNHLDFNDQSLRLDYGENELAAPQMLKKALFESYLVRKWVGDESSAEAPLRQLLKKRFNIPLHLFSQTIFANGVAPLFNALLKQCAQQKASLLMPAGSYGYFSAAADYQQVPLLTLATKEAQGFKIDPQVLEAKLQQKPGSWLFLNAPLVNPSGALYTSEELVELLRIACRYDATVIMDVIFSGLEFDANVSWDLMHSIEAFSRADKARLMLVGGISKEFAAGGLRFGYCWSTCRHMQNKLDLSLPHKPHFTLGYAVRKLFESQLAGNSQLVKHLQKQRQILADRAMRLSQLLSQKGWQVLPPAGGLFLVAKPQAFIENSDLSLTAAGDKVTELLFEQQNMAINNSTWTGLPGYCRFVLSGANDGFEQSLIRLAEFNLS